MSLFDCGVSVYLEREMKQFQVIAPETSVPMFAQKKGVRIVFRLRTYNTYIPVCFYCICGLVGGTTPMFL